MSRVTYAGSATQGGSEIIDPRPGTESSATDSAPDEPSTDDPTGNGHRHRRGADINPAPAHDAFAHPEHHSLLELPEIEVETGQTPIPPEERALIESEAPTMAKPVEDIAEDRSWLSHKLLNPRTIVSFVLAIGIIIFIFTRLDINPAETWSTMLTADPLFLVTGFVVYYSAFWLRAARWKQLLGNVGHGGAGAAKLPSINGLVEIIYLSWFVNCIVPAKLGDAYRSYLLKRNSGISFSSTIGTILAERVIDLLVLFGLLTMSFTLVGKNQLSSNKEFDLTLVMVLGTLMVAALVVGLVGLRFFGHIMVRFVPGRYKGKFMTFQAGILKSFKRRSLPILLGYTITIWLLEGGRLFFVTRSLDAHAVTISAVIFIALLSSLLTTLPLTPGGAGVVEGAVTLALGLFLKDDHSLAVSIALLDRLINYWSLVVGGLTLYIISRRR
ncbi:MAG TPA: lysylphosphatidylglycerol synthase transmembrane domain-containing protein [Chloroflexia bacterium]|nr:lysylphosphatidylglycerol synthase transmembrane domain-containing protein [Chloroflexia bacterium]